VYGGTGDGKTGFIGSMAKWIKFRTGKKMRLYTAEPDLGTIEHLIGDFIEVAYLKDRQNACETITLASHGWWPSPSGEWQPPALNVWDSIGAVAYEGATEFGTHILEELRVKGAEGSIISAEKAPAQFTSGKMKVAGNNQTHYGIAQGRLKEAINNSQKLPAHVIWTARILRVEDNSAADGGVFDKKFIYGPLLAGKAATADAPSWFGNCIHIDHVRVAPEKGKPEQWERRAYLKKHFDEGATIPYPAKLRVPPECEKDVPPYMVLDNQMLGAVKLFDLIEALRAIARVQAQQQITENKTNKNALLV
jgi:hypothetical protein